MSHTAFYKFINPFPSNKIVRKMGLSDDQEGIMRRYINESGNWQEHLNKTKTFIVECIEKIKPKKVAILGSGWLLDVPISYLAENCEAVYLYDIRHPRQITNKYKEHKNLHFKIADITGGLIEYTYQLIKNKKYSEISQIPEITFTPNEPVDFVVSVNLLNQLDILIVEYLRKFKAVSGETILQLRKKIQLAHLNSLLADKSCIISDFEELLYDRTGTLVENSSLIFHKFPKGKVTEEWIWKFDNTMSYYPNRNTHFKVKAVLI